MAGNEEKKNKGFSGLSDLASEVSGIDEPIKQEPIAEPKTSTPKQPLQPEREASPWESQRKTASTSQPVETVNSGKSGGGLGWIWVFGIIGFIAVIGVINSEDQNNKKSSYSPPSQSYSSSQRTPTPATQVETRKNVTESTEQKYTKPSIGYNNVLSLPEIRWCIKESIRIEAMRGVLSTQEEIQWFNSIVDDYNRRCGNYRYRQGSLSQAQRDVEPLRNVIVNDAIEEANAAFPSQVRSNVPSPNIISAKPSASEIREAQQLLAGLGYDPGPIDGQYGEKTANAVIAFQRSIGVAPDGWIDGELLSHLVFKTLSQRNMR